MQHLVMIACGGALGAVARYWVSNYVVSNITHHLPLGTLAVNVLGSLLMGACYVLILERSLLPPEMRPLLMVGLLGAFTTFSTFSLEVVAFLQEGHVLSALIYILLSVFTCVAALLGGVWLARLV